MIIKQSRIIARRGELGMAIDEIVGQIEGIILAGQWERKVQPSGSSQNRAVADFSTARRKRLMSR